MLRRLLLLTFIATQHASAEVVTFEKDVRPILKSHCFHCHGEGTKLRGGLDLRLRRLIAKGGDSGPGLVAHKPESSLVLDRVRLREMPPGDKTPKLKDHEIRVLETWIRQGAQTARAEPEGIDLSTYITEEERNFWAFQPVVRPHLPVVRGSDRVRHPIDRFLLSKMEQRGLDFAPDAGRRTLIRRVYLDTIGFPPSPEAVEKFVSDSRPDAYERLVDEMLASPHFGERWARSWLDVAGYSDSEGYTDTDIERPYAFKYRDYVIRAINSDKPYDEFLRDQLAGDEMVNPTTTKYSARDIELLTATGFLRMAPDGTGTGGVDQPTARNETIAKTIEIVSTSVLGLTVGCARCHNHRYDPISQEDYYRFRAIFAPALDWRAWKSPAQRRVSLYTNEDKAKASKIEAEAKKIDTKRLAEQKKFIEAVFEKELAKLPESIREKVRKARETTAKKRTPDQKKLLKKHPSVNVSASSLYLYDKKAADVLKKMAGDAAKLRTTKPKQEYLRALVEPAGSKAKTVVFIRGDHEQPGAEVEASELRILQQAQGLRFPESHSAKKTTGRRLAYARWLTDGKHPLTARVAVNRIWKGYFGKGVVPTPGDFGALGVRPTHPKLLDWLASEFVAHGWSRKWLHRTILLSSAYRQSSRRSAKAIEIDAQNELYSHQNVRRLEAEAFRDLVLGVSGKLNTKPFGPPVPVMADRVGRFVLGKENLNAGRPGPVIPLKGEEYRRTIYTQQRRTRPLSVLDAFDLPALTPNCTSRASSTVATQALLLMNSDFVQKYADALAGRVIREVGGEDIARIERAWLLVYSRRPTSEEREGALAFLLDQTKVFGASPDKKVAPAREALTSLCHALLSSNEFLYID